MANREDSSKEGPSEQGSSQEGPSQEGPSKQDLNRTPLRCPDQFPFPFEPYQIQKDFMRNIFTTIDEGSIGIFESPTGTGKSLSLICGALTWLKEYKKNMEISLKIIRDKEKIAQNSAAKSSDWLSADYENFKLKESLKAERLKIEGDLRRELQWKKRREKLAEKRKGMNRGDSNEITDCVRSIDNILKESKIEISSDFPDADLLPEEYDSDAEEKPFSEAFDVEIEHVRKIYYCTRTHSQVTQFIKELKRSPFGSSIRVSALASRQNLCVFQPVRQLKSQRLMNDRCIELQKSKSKNKPSNSNNSTSNSNSSTSNSNNSTSTGVKKRQKLDPLLEKCCPFYQKENIETLSSQILNEILDIEESAKAGIETLGCPYYASRLALPDAEVVAVPYNLILHRATREASGILVKNQIVIFDEAHNLLDAIAGMYNSEITERHVKRALSQLAQYHHRYRNRLTPKNTLYIKQLIFLLKKLDEIWPVLTVANQIFTIDKFSVFAKLDSINLFKVLAYCKKSFIARKLSSFSELNQDELAGNNSDGANSAEGATPASPLMIIEGFLETLTNANKDGRVVCTKDAATGGKLKFLLLNPAVYVTDLFQSARSVILAGGTMRPVSDFEDQLLTMAGVPPSRVHKFSCGHVVPPENILPIVLQSSPNGMNFQFNYENRKSEEMILQLGRLIANVSAVVPGGIVCFLSSYEYESLVFSILSKSPDVIKSIERKKVIFREPKQSSDVEGVLKTYDRAISHPLGAQTGAVLFAVVGGKLSEGINFSDDLGRCVIMVGLPFPNMYNVELQEKMNFLNAKLPKSPDGRLPGKVHYEGLCMKAVNQSIGRAIRHKGDYAVILLVDTRYSSPQISRALPEWIGDRLKIMPEFPAAFAAIRRFFTTKESV